VSLVPYRSMSDRVKLAREIAARTKPRFINTTAREPETDLKALARSIAAAKPPRFVTIPRERSGAKVLFTEEQLTAMRGRLSAEEYRWKMIRKRRKNP
jgi:hypothetical protein